METTERFEPLTAEEAERVRGGKTGDTGCFVIGTVLTALVSGVLIFMLTLGPLNLGRAAPVVVALVAAGLVAFGYYFMRSEKRKANRDLGEGRKSVLTAEVSKQFMKSYEGSRRRGSSVSISYYVEIAGKAYRVTEEDYYKYKKGMTVEVHTTPYGRTLLGIYDAESKRLLRGEMP
jgi:hypothetical protein